MLYGHNVTELFKVSYGKNPKANILIKSLSLLKLLSIMKNETAMRVIAKFVDEKYYVWFPSKIINAPRHHAHPDNNPEKIIRERFNGFANIRDIELKDLAEATGNWSKENIVGIGGFGAVFKCYWLSTLVAVKRVEIIDEKSKEFKISGLEELYLLNKCRHDNILPVYGYAIRDRFCYVVCQYMNGGSLYERLSGTKCNEKNYARLTWLQRLNIAKGVAR